MEKELTKELIDNGILTPEYIDKIFLWLKNNLDENQKEKFAEYMKINNI